MSVLVTKRTRALAVLLVAILSLSALPSMVMGGDAVTTASAAADLDVKVGWMSDIVNWNPMYLAMVEDWVACFLMYSALWQYDEKWDKSEPDLVLSYNVTYHPDGTMTMWLNLTHNAYFRNALNPTDTSMPLKAADVAYTFWVACSKQNTAWEYYMNEYAPTIIDDYTVRLDLDYTKATAVDDLTGIPIVPDGFYNWSGIALQDAMEPEECLGSGPFLFDDWVEASWWRWTTAPNYHATTDFGEERTIKIDSVTYQMSSESSILANDMNNGLLDVAVFTGEPDVFLDVLEPDATNKIVRESVQELGICDIAFNAVPLEFRSSGKGANEYCDGNLHLLDPAVRQALGMTLNKVFIREGIMRNQSTIADSVIPPGYWQADLEGVLDYDTADARQVLLDAGYFDNGGDFLEAGPTSYFMLNNFDDLGEDPILQGIRCQAPDTDPSWARIATSWLGWAKDAGIGFDPEFTGEERESFMINEAWYKCLYDIWVWHWGWGPEPLSDLSVWVTSEIVTGGDNCQKPMGEWYVHGDMDTDADGTIDVYENYTTCPYVSPEMIEEFGMDAEGFRGFSSFDQNFSKAKSTVNKADRCVIVKELQQVVYDSYCEFPPYYDVGLYAYTTLRYQGWGDWSENAGMTVISGMPWIWFNLIPAGNTIPEFVTGLQSDYEANIGESTPFSITVNDAENDKLWVNWTFGDGSDPVETVLESPDGDEVFATSHIYNEAGTYVLTVTVTDGYPYHTITDTADVNVMTAADAIPQLYGLTFSPSSPYVGDVTTWGVTAQDAEADSMTLTFAWGDGSYTVRTLEPDPVGSAVVVSGVTHTYTAANTYSVVISVWDGQPYASHNVSITRTYIVKANTAPTVPDISSVSTKENKWAPISATTSDADPDTLIVTWDWGDGSFNVTTHDTSSNVGAEVESRVYHRWDTAGTYYFDVWVDDQEGHNVTAEGTAVVTAEGTNSEPSGITVIQSPDPAVVDTTVTLTISAFDADEDPLDFYVEFGDGDAATDSTTGGPDTQTIVLGHVYATAGDFTVTVHVFDGTDNVSDTDTVRIVSPTENSVPEITLSTSYSAMYNETFVITPAFVYDEDPEDELSVWYDWGDDTGLSAGDPDAAYAGTHVYSVTGDVTLTAYVNDNTGLPGHNESETATVEVNYNRRPVTSDITLSPAGPYNVSDTITFTVIVSDDEGDDLTIRIDFGDGSAVQSVSRADPGKDVNVTVEFTHSYDVAETYYVYVWTEDDRDHPNPNWISLDVDVVIHEESTGGGETNWALIAGIIVLVLVVAVVAAMLLKKRKGKAEGGAGEGSGGMEGMAPPE